MSQVNSGAKASKRGRKTRAHLPCSICGVNPRVQLKNRIHSYCKECHTKKNRQWVTTHDEQSKAYQEKYRRAHPKPRYIPQIQTIFELLENPPTHNECILWENATSNLGYGQVCFDNKVYVVHRLVMELTLGRALGPEKDVCHHCDVRNCININHLFVGTAKDNIQDAIRKGRFPQKDYFWKFTRTYANKLFTDEQVKQLQQQLADGVTTIKELAVKYNVHYNFVWGILRGGRYKMA